MKLYRFITDNIEEILAEWESFAETLSPAADAMSGRALRDHARQILQAVALDIETEQNSEQQHQKSMGHAPVLAGGESAASIHGALRQASNFSLLQLSAEFRALRASVLRLWLPHVREMTTATSYEMVRFNEAIDQALAESVVTFSARADHTRELFLAILGHDLRAPLSTMNMAGEMLTRQPDDTVAQLGARVRRSARLMSSMVDDLLGYTRTQLGSSMPMTMQPVDVHEVCLAAVEDASAVHPRSQLELHASGNLKGSFDGVRLHQLFTNLLVNAAQYGDKERPIVITAADTGLAITVSVRNFGPAIPEHALPSMFKPLIQLPEGDNDERPRTSLGLGLFVAREIAEGHGGSIHVTSDSAAGTCFTVSLPRVSSKV